MRIIFLILGLCFIAFMIYRYKKYKNQREIEEMAADAQAYIGSETLELLQRYKVLVAENRVTPMEQKDVQKKFNILTQQLVCYTTSESSVRNYLTEAEQNLALLRNKLEVLSNPETKQINDEFDSLK